MEQTWSFKWILYNIIRLQDELKVIQICTVGENIIATTKIRNNYCAIQSFKFRILPLVNVSLLIIFASFFYQFFTSFLMALSLKLSLFHALKGDSEKITNYFFANAFKSVKERQLHIWEAIQKRSYEPIYKTHTKIEAKKLRAITFAGRAITKWGAIEKSSILLSQYWKKYHF